MTQRIAIYGGGFDPPTIGHDNCLRALLESWADRVLIVPTGTPVHKRASATPAAMRLAWCKAWAARYDGRAEVIDWEITGRLSGFTADLAARAAREYPGAQLAVAIGADQFKVFHTWERGPEILDHAGLLVIPRGGVPSDPNHVHHLRRQGHQVTLLDVEPVEASSSAIRQLRAAGDPAWKNLMLADVAALVPALTVSAA